MKKNIEIRFSKEVYEFYEKLKNEKDEKKFEKKLLNSINEKLQLLKKDPHSGIHIPKRNISKKIIEKYKTDKLWKINLYKYWRLLYTIFGDDEKIIVLILKISDHKEYNNLFGYKKR